jgi:hypothetical protein
VSSWSPAEVRQIVEAERAGRPFLLWRDSAGGLQLRSLDNRGQLTIGRSGSSNIPLNGDGEVSRLHALLEQLGEEWTLVDDGLSRNGTFLNGERLSTRRRLADGDLLRFGETVVEYRDPSQVLTAVTVTGSGVAPVDVVTVTQRAILVALCRPYRAVMGHPRPATNAEIASEVFLGVDAVKAHLRALYKQFGLSELPQNQKRTQLAIDAMRAGLVPNLIAKP